METSMTVENFKIVTHLLIKKEELTAELSVGTLRELTKTYDIFLDYLILKTTGDYKLIIYTNDEIQGFLITQKIKELYTNKPRIALINISPVSKTTRTFEILLDTSPVNFLPPTVYEVENLYRETFPSIKTHVVTKFENVRNITMKDIKIPDLVLLLKFTKKEILHSNTVLEITDNILTN